LKFDIYVDVIDVILEQYCPGIEIFGAILRYICRMGVDSLHLCTWICAIVHSARMVRFHYLDCIDAVALLLRFALGNISWGELYSNYVGNFGSEYVEIFASCA